MMYRIPAHGMFPVTYRCDACIDFHTHPADRAQWSELLGAPPALVARMRARPTLGHHRREHPDP